jgi:hypothetical protein
MPARVNSADRWAQVLAQKFRNEPKPRQDAEIYKWVAIAAHGPPVHPRRAVSLASVETVGFAG